MSDIVERLRNCENDPMWADHAEIPKRWCKQAADEIDRLREEIEVMILGDRLRAERDRLREALETIQDHAENYRHGDLHEATFSSIAMIARAALAKEV